MDRSLLIWGMVLILGIPILTIVLGESSERLEQKGNPLGQFLRKVRTYLLPALALWLSMRMLVNFLQIGNADLSLKIIETIFCLTILYTCFSLMNSVFTSKVPEFSWQIRIPNLFFQVARVSVILMIAGYVIENIWQVNLADLITPVGIGSLVFALALQDTLSSLVSGFLLLLDSPFKVGDWIQYNNIEGEVTDINWRAVRVALIYGEEVIIPNSILGKGVIYNLVKLNPFVWRSFLVRFSYEDPPNRVKEVVLGAIKETEGILDNPKPSVKVVSYDDFFITYNVKLAIDKQDFKRKSVYEDAAKTRIYYAAKRHNLTIPLPTAIQYKVQGKPEQPEMSPAEINEFLSTLPYFTSIDHQRLEILAKNFKIAHYGVGDRVVQMGEADRGFYIILEGRIQLSVMDIYNRKQEVMILGFGDFFGQLTLLSGEPSPVTGKVIEDLKVLEVEPMAMSKFLEKNNQFALQINQFFEKRKKEIDLAKGTLLN